MALFVGARGKDPVPVRLTAEEREQAIADGWEAGDIQEGDTMYILKKMNFGQKQKMLGTAARMKFDVGAMQRAAEGKSTEADDAANDESIAFDMGQYNVALAQTNIVSWDGPSFEGVPCTLENIMDLDPEHPLLVKVLQEISRRNTKQKGSPSPN